MATSDAPARRCVAERAERGAGADTVPPAEIYGRSRALLPARRKASSASPPPLRARRALFLRFEDIDASLRLLQRRSTPAQLRFIARRSRISLLSSSPRNLSATAPPYISLPPQSAFTKHIKCSHCDPTGSQLVLPFYLNVSLTAPHRL
ncbi:hypothetical protein MTO96_015829 [Rhipicephalus appendiculatus]